MNQEEYHENHTEPDDEVLKQAEEWWEGKLHKEMKMEYTAEQKLEVIKKGGEVGLKITPVFSGNNLVCYAIEEHCIEENSWHAKIGGIATFEACLDKLREIFPPEPKYIIWTREGYKPYEMPPVPAPKWQDDEGWQGTKAKCDNHGVYCRNHCLVGIHLNHDKDACPLCYQNIVPRGDMWHPPIDPRTNEPYLTLAAWQADNPVKAVIPPKFPKLEMDKAIYTIWYKDGRIEKYRCDLSPDDTIIFKADPKLLISVTPAADNPVKREMTDHEKGHIQGSCRRGCWDGCPFLGENFRSKYPNIPCKHCYGRTNTMPNFPKWQAPLVPVNFKVVE